MGWLLMSRTIEVSTEVFAAIWALREAGEETEDAILKRVLTRCEERRRVKAAGVAQIDAGGIRDIRNGVDFPEGFEIIRTYKGKEYRAEARSGAWVRKDTGERYPTLNQLNASIAAGSENVWNGNWKYQTTKGTLQSISFLRREDAERRT